MKNIFMMAAVCIVAVSCNRAAMPSATPYINAEIKNEQDNTILAGHCFVSKLYTAPYKDWFYKSYNEYTVDSAAANQLKPLLKNKTIEIFLGSWCGDSKREVPHMIKILQAASFDTADLRLIFVDNSAATYKQSPQHEEKEKNIHHVPTVIIYDKRKEVGRIIESPVVSLEKDLLAILQQQAYVPHYRSIVYWQQHISRPNTILADYKLLSLVTQFKTICDGMRDFNAYGNMLLAQHNFNEALNVFRLNVLLYADVAGVYSSLGKAYLTIGNKTDAKSNLDKALALKPGDENIMKLLDELKL
jgi:thiol-disulfide isomerase/thioredoxin